MQKTQVVKLVKDSETPETLTPKEKLQLELRKTAGALIRHPFATPIDSCGFWLHRILDEPEEGDHSGYR